MQKKGINYKNYYRDREYRQSEELFKNIFKKRYHLIVKSNPAGWTVLDIGCSNGVFLDLFKETGWETWGVEPSGSADVAKRKRHKIIKNYFEKANLPKNYYDLVIMNHTLEHMENPSEVLSKIHKLLKPEGILFVDVPNAGGLGARILGKNWPYLLPEEHKHQFTRQSLTSLLEKSDFKVIHFESRSGLFEYANPLAELYQALLGMKKRLFTDIFLFPFSLAATILNMGDSMSLVARSIK